MGLTRKDGDSFKDARRELGIKTLLKVCVCE
jgi:hypothetical protein